MLVLTYFSTLWISLSSLQLCLASFSLFLLLCGIKIVIVSMVHNGEFYRHTCFSYSPWVNQCTNTDGRSDIHSGSGHMFFLCSEWLYSNSTHMNFNYLLQLYMISHHSVQRTLRPGLRFKIQWIPWYPCYIWCDVMITCCIWCDGHSCSLPG